MSLIIQRHFTHPRGGRFEPESVAGLVRNLQRLWKSVKYEEVYLKAYGSIAEAKQELTKYFDRYNKKRRHQGLDNMTPDEVYCNTLPELQEAV